MFFFCVFIVLSAFWFVVCLLQRDAIHHLVATFYLCGRNSDKQSRFYQSKISNYGRQYVEKLES